MEYKDGCEEVVAMRVGQLGSVSLAFAAPEQRQRLCGGICTAWAKRRTTITVDHIYYDVRVRIYDSFGEEAFRVEFEQTAGRPNKGVAPDRSPRSPRRMR